MKIFENLKVIILWRPELGNKMCMVTRSIPARKDKKCISEPANCSTYKSVDSLVQACNLVYDLFTPTLITQEQHSQFFPKFIVLKSLSQ